MTILISMVRTRSFDPSEALQRAVELFSARGYSDTSMDDLVKATGVSRYGLYGTFGNKRELFEQALNRYADAMGRRRFLRLKDPDASFADIKDIFDERIRQLANSGENRGCMIAITALELAPHDKDISALIHKQMRGMAHMLSLGLASARDRGEVRADVDCDSAGEFLMGTLFGLSVMARAGFSRPKLQTFVTTTLAPFTA